MEGKSLSDCMKIWCFGKVLVVLGYIIQSTFCAVGVIFYLWEPNMCSLENQWNKIVKYCYNSSKTLRIIILHILFLLFHPTTIVWAFCVVYSLAIRKWQILKLLGEIKAVSCYGYNHSHSLRVLAFNTGFLYMSSIEEGKYFFEMIMFECFLLLFAKHFEQSQYCFSGHVLRCQNYCSWMWTYQNSNS